MLSKGMDRKNFFLAWLLCSVCAGVAGCYMVSVSMRNDAYYPIWAMAMYCFIGSFFGGLFMHGWMQGNKVFWGEEADMGKAGVMLFMALFFMDLILLANGSNFAFHEALKNGEVVSCKMEIRRGDFYCMGSAEKISLKEEDKEKWKPLYEKIDQSRGGVWRARLSKNAELQAICRGNACFSIDEFLSSKVLKTGKVKK